MITEVQATIQALATVESLNNDIDQLAVLDRQVKDLTKQCKKLKDDIIEAFDIGTHRGEKYGVRVTIENRKGAVDMEALCKAFNITEADLDKFRGESSAVIKVTPTA